MKQQIAEVCEHLFALAKEKGERTTSYDSERSDGENVGYGSRHDRTHYTLMDEPFTIKATEDRWVQWNPNADWNGTTQLLEVSCGGKSIFSATHEGVRRIKRFTAGDESYAGAETEDAEPWKALHGNLTDLPAKYLNAATEG